jgi:methylated-DNA-[protein]-cysteine S-methyltransferase
MHQAKIKTAAFKTDWGWIAVLATAQGVAAVTLPCGTRQAAEEQLHALVPLSLRTAEGGEAAGVYLERARTAILAYLQGNRQAFDLPLDIQGGTPFHRKVWEALRRIPYGRVRSYGWVAKKVGKPDAARAVGSACGANPLPLVSPCHRVVAADGTLGGFAGGLRMKKRLLTLEGII